MNPNIIRQVFDYLKHIDDVRNFAQTHPRVKNVYRTLDVWRLTELTNDPEQKLQIFLDYYSDLPPQGSPDWLKNRTGFGGSDIGGLLGVDRFKNRKQIYYSKLGMSSFKGNTATRWGNLFEEVLFGITDRIFGITSYETGSIPGLRNTNGEIIQSYSPDRIATIPLKTFVNTVKRMGKVSGIAISGKIPKKDKLVVLMEGKCPISRVPNGVVPKQYTLQPQLGAFTIPIVDMCLFVDGMFRKCSVQQFGLNGDYDRNFHKGIDTEDAVLLAGFIGFYSDDSDFADSPNPGDLKNPRDQKNKKVALIQCIIETLKSRMIAHVANPHADFHGVRFELGNLMSLCALCDRYLNVIYDEMHEQIQNIGLQRSDEESLVIQALQELCEPDIVTQSLIAKLVPDALSANYKQTQKYDFSELQYGIDAGDTSDFEFILRNAIDNRFTNQGFKIYYPNAYYASDALRQYVSDYQDDSQTVDARAKKWLYKSVEQYLDWCQTHQKQSVGILPWKLMRINYIPMAKNTDLIRDSIPQILRASEELQELKSGSSEDREKKLSELFPSKRVKPSDSENVDSEIPDYSDFMQEIIAHHTT